MNQDDLSDFANQARAQNLVRVVERFVSTLNSRAGEKHAAAVILEGRTLDGRTIQQEPERFIEDELIEPTLEVLGYEPRFRPKGFNGLSGRIPDFTSLNLAVTNFGEVKKPGNISDARKESFQYLEMAEDRPLVGVATDGFVWILHSATEPGERPVYQHHAVLHQLVEKIRMEQTQASAKRRSRRQLREYAHKFVSEFNRETVENRFC